MPIIYMADGPEVGDSTEPPFTLHVPGGETLQFHSYEEVAFWAGKEKDDWQTLQPHQKSLGPAAVPAIDAQISTFTQLQARAREAVNSTNQSARDETGKLLSMIARGDRVVSTSPTGLKILDLAGSDPKKALGHLIWEIPGVDIRPGNHSIEPLLKSLIDTRLDQREGIGDVVVEKAALENLRANWEETFIKIGESQRNLEREFENWASLTQATVTDRIRQARRVSKSVVRRFRKVRDAHDAEMTAMQRTFRTELSLREPAIFWRDKAETHRSVAITAFVGLILIAAGILAATIVGPGFLLTEKIVTQLQFGSALLLAVPAIALFWIMKAVGRIFVTNVQLHADARQRSTMMTTFVSLMQDPKNQMTMEDRLLILQALFRPSGAEVQEEGPPSWVDVLLRRMDGQSK